MLPTGAFGNADTLATSYSIVSAANTAGKFDLIFAARKLSTARPGQMGSQLAERFDAAQITSASLIKDIDFENRKLTVERELEEGTETLEVTMPCLFTMEKKNYPLRLPSLKNWMASKKAVITTLTSKDIPGLDLDRIGDPGSPTKVRACSRRSCRSPASCSMRAARRRPSQSSFRLSRTERGSSYG